MKRRIALALICLLLASGLPAFAGNLYALIFVNTEDKGIGCIYDALKMGPFLKDAQKATGLTLKARVHLTKSAVSADDLKSLTSWAVVVDGWSRADLEKEIKALAPTKDDTVVFYYSGHGGRMSDKAGKWPDMAMQNDNLVDLQYPVELMTKKAVQPRLMLSFGDCCNSYMDRSVSMKTRSAKSTAALKDLFLNSTGTVIASGCVPGQYSLGGSDGGVFTNAYLNSTYNAMNTTWDSVMKNTKILASSSTEGKQVPQFEVNARGMSVVPAAPSTTTTAVTPAASTDGEEETEAAEEPGDEDESETVSEESDTPLLDALIELLSDAESSSELSFLPIRSGKASGTRKPGGSDFPFVELKAAGLSARGGDLVVVMDLVQIPKKLAFNDPGVPIDDTEYEWGAYIDADGSGEPQYLVCLDHFKEKGSKKASDTLLNQCSAALYALSEEGGELMDVEVEATVEKNRITLLLSDYEECFTLEKGAQVYFSALYYPGGESHIP